LIDIALSNVRVILLRSFATAVTFAGLTRAFLASTRALWSANFLFNSAAAVSFLTRAIFSDAVFSRFSATFI